MTASTAPSIPLGQRLFSTAGRIGGDWLLRRFRRSLPHARRINRETLRQILDLHWSCDFGRKYRFESLSSEEAFRDAVPLGGWDDYAPYVDRMTRGEANVLCSEPVIYFALSSGTTGRPKLIPTTQRQQRMSMLYMSLMMPAVLRQLVPETDKPYRGIILLGASSETNVTPGGTPVGSASGGGVARAKGMAGYLWPSPWPVYAWGISPATWYLHALFGLRERTALTLSGIFAPHVLEWLDFVIHHWDALLADLEKGTLDGAPGLSDERRAELAPFLAPAPERAAEVRAAVGRDFAGFVPRAWPYMRAAMAVASGSFSVYEPRLRHFLGGLPLYSPVYGSSEAMIGFNLRLQPTGHYTLTPGSAYFEFVPVARIDEAQPRTVTLDGLAVGEQYELVVTNTGGLYRYRMRDVVRVVGFDGEAPVLEFQYRYGTLLNVAGEKTTEAQTHAAITRLVERWTGDVKQLVDYTTRADSDRLPPRYVIYVELRDAEAWARADLTEAAKRLDQALSEANLEYDVTYRKTDRVGGPELKLVSPGTFRALQDWMFHRAKGMNANQMKLPRRLSDPEPVALMESRVLASAAAPD